jgi:hypothetical protein
MPPKVGLQPLPAFHTAIPLRSSRPLPEIRFSDFDDSGVGFRAITAIPAIQIITFSICNFGNREISGGQTVAQPRTGP